MLIHMSNRTFHFQAAAAAAADDDDDDDTLVQSI